MTAQQEDGVWIPVCARADLPVERGVTALVRGQAVAIFLLADGGIHAIANHDPFSRAGTLGRGIVGVRGDVPFVFSSEGRRAFDLRTGHCLDAAGVSVASYPVRVVHGVVQVGPRS